MRAPFVWRTALLLLALGSSVAIAQTTAGIGTTIVFPVIAQTSSFASEVTVYNPGPNALIAHVTFFEANNSSTPGTKVCTDASVPANRSAQFSIGTQCPLAAVPHFGLLVVADSANPQTNAFYGYTRVQNPLGIGFSVEGFPVQNFNNQVSHATGLKRQAASPTYQTNCFVGSLEQSLTYELKLFNDTTGAQIGETLTGSLSAFQQYRYLDIFGPNGVNAPAGDQFNVRAQFTQTSGGTANLIGFCTVQDNTSFGADFRIAKSYGSPSNSFFAQGGNAFGTTAMLGTLDDQPLELHANNQRVMRYEPNATSPNMIGGHSSNTANPAVGQTIGGGGAAGTQLILDGNLWGCNGNCSNRVIDAFGTIGGGVGNQAGNGTVSYFATVSGGDGNQALGLFSTVAGGAFNSGAGESSTVGGGFSNSAGRYGAVGGGLGNNASGSAATVPGGSGNTAAGAHSFAAGVSATADADGCFVWNDGSGGEITCGGASFVHRVVMRADGGYIFLSKSDNTIGAQLMSGAGSWSVYSDRDQKDHYEPVASRWVLQQVAVMPINTWNWKSQGPSIRHMGPTSQDFHSAFGLGESDTMINTVDAQGVALAAIQGLHQLVQERDARIAALEQQVTELQSLRGELAALRAAIAELIH